MSYDWALCCFGASAISAGKPALGQYENQCVWCNSSELDRRCHDARLRNLLVYQITVFQKLSPGTVYKALARIPTEWRHIIAEASIGASADDLNIINALAAETQPRNDNVVADAGKDKSSGADAESGANNSSDGGSSEGEEIKRGAWSCPACENSTSEKIN